MGGCCISDLGRDSSALIVGKRDLPAWIKHTHTDAFVQWLWDLIRGISWTRSKRAGGLEKIFMPSIFDRSASESET
jgi:hypothetical protein